MVKNKYIPTFGVEVHAELSTKTKAFSPSLVGLNDFPNSNVNSLDMGYPGTKPTVNGKMVKIAYRVSKALDMEIDTYIRFDRKRYFYPDLPKGYQITQYFNPIGKKGKLVITFDDGKTKDIRITQLHMEEDTAKQFSKDGVKYFDFNRSGVPLIEIVSGHEDLETIDELILYLKQLREQLMILEASDGKMEEGSFRVDVNVSVRKNIKDEYGTRVELKNLNSFKNIREALEYEINLQIETIENGDKVEEVTKRFDEETRKTIVMRTKNQIKDNYNFIPEGNIIPIKLSEETITSFELKPILRIDDLKRNLRDMKLSREQIEIFSQYSNLYTSLVFISLDLNVKKVANFLTTIFLSEIQNSNIDLFKYDIPVVFISKVISLTIDNKITNSEAKELIKELLSKKNITKKINFYKNREVASNDNVKEIIVKIIEGNPEKKEEVKTRPERVFKFLMGQLMKETQGKVNPKEASKLIDEILKEYE